MWVEELEADRPNAACAYGHEDDGNIWRVAKFSKAFDALLLGDGAVYALVCEIGVVKHVG